MVIHEFLLLKESGDFNTIVSRLERKNLTSHEYWLLLESYYYLNKKEELEKLLKKETNFVSSKKDKLLAEFFQAVFQKLNNNLDDSLNRINAILTEDTAQLTHYELMMIKIELASIFRASGKYQQSIKTLQTLLVNESTLPLYQLSLLHNILGLSNRDIGNIQEALNSFEKALNVQKHLKNDFFRYSTLNNIALIQHDLGNFDQALVLHEQALMIAEQSKKTISQITSLVNIGAINQKLGKLSLAMNQYQRALFLSKQIKNDQYFAIIENNIGNLYKDQGLLSVALKYLSSSLEYFSESKNIFFLAMCQANLGELYFDRGEYSLADKFHQEAFKTREHIGNPREIASSIFDLLVVRRETRKLSTDDVLLKKFPKQPYETLVVQAFKEMIDGLFSLEKGRFDESERFWKKALTISGLDFDYQLKCYEFLTHIAFLKYLDSQDDSNLKKFLKSLQNWEAFVIENHLPASLCSIHLVRAKLFLIKFQLDHCKSELQSCIKQASSAGLPLHEKLATGILLQINSLEQKKEPLNDTKEHLEDLKQYLHDIKKILMELENEAND